MNKNWKYHWEDVISIQDEEYKNPLGRINHKFLHS